MAAIWVCSKRWRGSWSYWHWKTKYGSFDENLHKFFNKMDIPWVQLIWEKHYRNGKLPSHIKKGSFWWRDVLKFLDDFRVLASPQIGCGDSALFWLDKWNGQPLSLSLLLLLSSSHLPPIGWLQSKRLSRLVILLLFCSYPSPRWSLLRWRKFKL